MPSIQSIPESVGPAPAGRVSRRRRPCAGPRSAARRSTPRCPQGWGSPPGRRAARSRDPCRNAGRLSSLIHPRSSLITGNVHRSSETMRPPPSRDTISARRCAQCGVALGADGEPGRVAVTARRAPRRCPRRGPPRRARAARGPGTGSSIATRARPVDRCIDTERVNPSSSTTQVRPSSRAAATQRGAAAPAPARPRSRRRAPRTRRGVRTTARSSGPARTCGSASRPGARSGVAVVRRSSSSRSPTPLGERAGSPRRR